MEKRERPRLTQHSAVEAVELTSGNRGGGGELEEEEEKGESWQRRDLSVKVSRNGLCFLVISATLDTSERKQQRL